MSHPVTDNREFIHKADLALGDLTTGGGLLQPAQAARFMRILISEAVITRMAAVVPMRSPKQLIEKIRFASRVLRPGQEATALSLADRSRPDLTKVELDAKLFKAEVKLSDEILEDSIERSQLRQTVMTLMAERIALDTDELVANGNTGSADAFLAVLDGIRTQATSNVVNAGGQFTNKTIFRDMLKNMPSEFLRNKRAMWFFTSVDSDIDYRDALADRGTILGDRFLEQEAPVSYSGVRLQPVPVFPEDLGGGNDETEMILTDPKNINVGIWRRIKIETDKDISEGVLKIVATIRMDVKYAEETAVVKATGVQVS